MLKQPCSLKLRRCYDGGHPRPAPGSAVERPDLGPEYRRVGGALVAGPDFVAHKRGADVAAADAEPRADFFARADAKTDDLAAAYGRFADAGTFNKKADAEADYATADAKTDDSTADKDTLAGADYCSGRHRNRDTRR
jgi:hypothetical protein